MCVSNRCFILYDSIFIRFPFLKSYFHVYYSTHIILKVPFSLSFITFKFVFCVWLHFIMWYFLSHSLLSTCPLVTWRHFTLLDVLNLQSWSMLQRQLWSLTNVCVMFSFQLGSLHISKDVSYDFNNLVLNLLYKIPTTSSKGRQWVVGCGRYCMLVIVLFISFKKQSWQQEQ
jgi:hypothetical protein